MAYQALYRQWRPRQFSEIFGQDAVVTTLMRQVTSGRIAHAYLFCGTRGTGKTTASKVFSRAINCLDKTSAEPCGECEVCKAILAESCMDVVEIDAASNNGVDEIRDLREKVKYPPTMAKHKVYIIDEVHMLSTGAFNALLKTLEEPPAHAVFILATTEPQRLPATILSRCQRFDFHRISADTIIDKLMIVLGGIGRTADDGALYEVARAAEGSMRDAMSLMDVCLAYTDGEVTSQLARDVLGTSGREFMFDFMDALIMNDAKRCLELIAATMDLGRDPQVFARDTVSHARTALLAGILGSELADITEITEEDAQRYREQASKAPREKFMRIMELFMKAEPDMKWALQPRTVLELCAVRACHPEVEKDASLEERVAKVENAVKNGIAIAVPAAGAAPAETAAPAAEAAATAAAPVQQAAANSAADAPQEYLSAVAALMDANPSLKAALSAMIFVSVNDSIVTVEFPKKNLMFQKILERKVSILNEAFTAKFGRNMTVAMRAEGINAAAAKTSSPAKKIIEQSYDIFGRENIEIRD